MYMHAVATVRSIIYDPTKGGTDVDVEVHAVGDSGEDLYAPASVVLPGATGQASFDAALDAAVASVLSDHGVSLGAGRVLVLGARIA